MPAFLFVLAALLLTPFTERKVSANNYYSELFGGAPLIQDWNDTTQVTVDNDWTNVVSYQGFRGDGLTASIGTDPQTIVADGQSTPLDVNANQTNPDSFATGGVTEFEIANPTIALKGSDTADAPHLMLYIDTTPCPANKSISIRYNVRDLDGSANDAVQQLALQYRIGTTGNFQNVPAGFVPDATDPNTATKVTSKLVNLPGTIINNPQVEIRFITANAAGTDEWIGIDDIDIGCFFPTSAQVTLAGRVLTADSRGIPYARISVLNTFTLDTSFATTNQFGNFLLEGLDGGDFYIISVDHRRYRFSDNTRTLRLADDQKGIVFYADRPLAVKKRLRSTNEMKVTVPQ
ncbi:MAG: carboxypeptidase-like regulatory domain-containing protein [Acidobacteriota bacterium]|nr:carboxypeptidase-like regulatory domain-containing protein [Acidobacteriota bacterium]